MNKADRGRAEPFFRPLYIFSILAFLLGATLWTVSHTGDVKESVSALLNIIAGGLLALLGTVVNHEFGAAKREQPARASDATAAPQVPNPPTPSPETKP